MNIIKRKGLCIGIKVRSCISFSISLLLVLVLTACGSGGNNGTGTENVENTGNTGSPIIDYITPAPTGTPVPTPGNQKSNLVEIAKYTTPLLNKTDSRINNIEIAIQKMDNMSIEPGEEFSFNKVVGRRTEAKGYEEAPIIIKTEDGPKKGYGVGGGICQLSTTLYNTVEKAGLQVTERHLHSKDVGYVQKGDDATVAYGSADFRFVNNRKYPVVIRIYLSKDKLTVKLFENRS